MSLNRVKSRLLKKCLCSEATLDLFLASVGINDSFENESNSRVVAKYIDPPIINGKNLLEHPVKETRERYAKLLSNNGKLVGLFVDGQFSAFAFSNQTQNRLPIDENPVRKIMVDNIIMQQAENELPNKFDQLKNNKWLPKNAKGEDLLFMFTQREQQLINESQSEPVKEAIAKIKDKKTTLKDKDFIDALHVLNSSSILSKRTYKEIMDAVI